MIQTLRHTGVAIKLLLVMTVVLGVVYPAAVWAVGNVAMPGRAHGQLERVDAQVVGSRIVATHVASDARGWFRPRDSASDHDALASGATHLGPSSPELLQQIRQRRADVAQRESAPAGSVPPDAVTASASGLDPYISPEYAQLQVPRVARERGLSQPAVRAMVRSATSDRTLGFLGQPRVNVAALNIALARVTGQIGAH